MSDSKPAAFVAVRGLVKRYPGVTALDHADLDIERGAVLGLLGKNGAGKSTLIKILAGVVQPDGGSIRVDGEEVHIENARRAAAIGLAFVHQELEGIPNLSVAENVNLGLGFPRRAGVFVDRRKLTQLAGDVLERLEAEISPRASLRSLSVAHQRLVMIARALAADARALVLDEPTTALTDDEITHLHAVIKRLRDAGVAVVYVTHRLDEIFAVADSAAVMRDGKTISVFATSEITKTKLIEEITGTRLAAERARPSQAAVGEELLRVRGLTTPAGDGHELVLHRGEVLGIAGLVGSGRTSLARRIAGADAAHGCEVWIDGLRRRIRSPRDALSAGIVMLPEDRRRHGAVLDFSIRKNITLPTLRRHRLQNGIPIPKVRSERATAKRHSERLGIRSAGLEQRVRHLSGGNQQKAILAKWLECGAKVLIFDEPTQGIDVNGKNDVYDLMLSLASEGKGVVFISSEFAELVAACNRVLVMREGRLVAEVSAEGINEGRLVSLCYGG